MTKITFGAVLALCLASSAASAGSLYYGLGLGFASATSLPNPGAPAGTESSADFPVLGLTAGYRFDAGSYFVTGEVDADVAFGTELANPAGDVCAVNATAPYFCTVDAVLRLRGLIGMPVSAGWEGFASIGAAAVMGSSATSPGTSAANTNIGFTLGLGAQGHLFGTGTTRIELIYDQANSSVTTPGGYDPEYESWGIKATWLF